MLHSRIKRVEELVKSELGEIIDQEIRDPRPDAMITVNRVKVSKDLRHALVFVSILETGKQSAEAVLEQLRDAKGYIRKLLGQRVTLRYLPDLVFKHDTSASYAVHIQEIINQIHEEKPPSTKEEEKETEDMST